MNKSIINGIDVSEYFIEVVDEGGSTIDYKILPNSERLLVEKIFEQNQQLKRLQEENKRLQMLSCANCGEKYLSPDGAELYEKNVQLQKENEKQKEQIKQLEDFIKSDGEIDHINHEYTYKLRKENKELEKELEQLNKKCYETLKMLKHEYDGRQKDNEQWFTRCTENHNEDSKVIEKYRSALENIKDYCIKTTSRPLERKFILTMINEALNE